MIRYPALGEVVGADTFGTITAAHQALAGFRHAFLLLFQLGILKAGGQQAQGLGAVLVLGTFLLALHHNARGQVGDADGRVGFVHVLTTGTGGAEGIHPQIGFVDLDRFGFVSLRHYSNRAGRGVDAALGFGFRHSLHPVRTGFKFQGAINAIAREAGDDFLETAVLPFIFAEHLDLPPAFLGIAGIHAKQVAGKDSGFIAPGAGTDFQEHVLGVIGVFGQH